MKELKGKIEILLTSDGVVTANWSKLSLPTLTLMMAEALALITKKMVEMERSSKVEVAPPGFLPLVNGRQGS